MRFKITEMDIEYVEGAGKYLLTPERVGNFLTIKLSAQASGPLQLVPSFDHTLEGAGRSEGLETTHYTLSPGDSVGVFRHVNNFILL